MKAYRSTRKMGLAVLTGGLAFVGTAEATELITDGSFENTKTTSTSTVKIGGVENPGIDEGWSFFSTYAYSTDYTLPGPTGSGLQFLRPYPSGQYGITQSRTNITQLVNLIGKTTLTADKIDSGSGSYNMSAWFSSYRTQGDFSTLTLQFMNSGNQPVGDAILLGGSDFAVNLPTDVNKKYGDAKSWGQDTRSGTVPTGARTARVTIISQSANNDAPDGYVDLVSLDVVDAGAGIPTLSAAVPGDNAVGVGPVVNLDVTLQDRATTVNGNSIQLFLDNNSVTPTIQKSDASTMVHFSAGILAALSQHTYKIIFSDNGTPVTTQTNLFKFTVADYMTLPASLKTPLGSEDTTKPGFDVSVYQVDSLIQTDPSSIQQLNLPPSVEFSESVLAGLIGPNVADLSSASSNNTFAVTGVIDWVNSSAAPNANGISANFPNDLPFPGIPGTTGIEDSFVDDIRTYIRFPASGFYQLGVNNEDQFRLNAGYTAYQTLQLVAPTNLVIPCVPIATNINQLQFGGSLPLSPLTAQIVYATPSGNPDDACQLSTNTSLAGKIALLDRGGTGCDSAAKAEQAQRAGAVAVIEITPGDTGYPFRLGDINTNVRIPVLVIADSYQGSVLKSYLTQGTSVTATIRGDANSRIMEWDGPKGFGPVDVTAGFAVPEAGVYPMRLVAGQESGGANLEWFSVMPDGTRILVNDTSNPNALLAFRARKVEALPASFNAPTLAAGKVTLSWTGSGTLEEAASAVGPWQASGNQSNPQTVTASDSIKLYRIRQ